MEGVGPGSTLGGRYTVGERREEYRGAERWEGHDRTTGDPITALVIRSSDPRAHHVVEAARRAMALENTSFVRVLDTGTSNGVAYVIEEALPEARSLTTLLESGALPPDDARRIAGESAVALENAAKAGLHHQDLRTNDVLITAQGDLKLRGLETAASVAGLENVESEKAQRKDAVGVIALMYAGLTGLWPYRTRHSGLSQAPRMGSGVAAPSEIAAGVPTDLDGLSVLTLRSQGGPKTPADLAKSLVPWGARPIGSRRSVSAAPAGNPGGEDGEAKPVLVPVNEGKTKAKKTAGKTKATKAAAAKAAANTPAVQPNSVDSANKDGESSTTDEPTADSSSTSGKTVKPAAKAAAKKRAAKAPEPAEPASTEAAESGDASGSPAQEPVADGASTPDQGAPSEGAGQGQQAPASPADAAQPAAKEQTGPKDASSVKEQPAAKEQTGPKDAPTAQEPPGPKEQPAAKEQAAAKAQPPVKDRPAPRDPPASKLPGPPKSSLPPPPPPPAAPSPPARPEAPAAKAPPQPSQSQGAQAPLDPTGWAVAEDPDAPPTYYLGGPGLKKSAARKAKAARALREPREAAVSAAPRPPVPRSATPAPSALANRPRASMATTGAMAGLEIFRDPKLTPASPQPQTGEGIFGAPVPYVPTEPLNRSESRTALAIIGAFVVAALIVGVLGVNQLFGSINLDLAEPLPSIPATTAKPSASAKDDAGLEKLAIVGVKAYDPNGDGAENDALAPKVYDGDPATDWHSESYATPELGGLKPGVGVIADLGPNKSVRQVELALPYTSDVTVYVGTKPTKDGAKEVGAKSNVKGKVTFDVPSGTKGEYIVVWFTKVGTDDQGKNRAYLGELTALG